MVSDLIPVLCAIGALFLPLTLAWAFVMFRERRRQLREQALGERSGTH
jgi:hypothetical protein